MLYDKPTNNNQIRPNKILTNKEDRFDNLSGIKITARKSNKTRGGILVHFGFCVDKEFFEVF